MFDFLSSYSYIGLFAILFVEEAGIPIPIPGDLFIAAASTLKNSSFFLIVITVQLATLAGSTILFTIAKKFGHQIILKYGKKINFTQEKIKKVDTWFSKYGMYAIIFGRLIPGFRTITPFAAGLFNLSYRKFWLSTAISAFIWATIYFLIGKFFKEILTSLVQIFS